MLHSMNVSFRVLSTVPSHQASTFSVDIGSQCLLLEMCENLSASNDVFSHSVDVIPSYPAQALLILILMPVCESVQEICFQRL